MKLFRVIRTSNAGYDEFNGFVVRAENAENALKLCNDKVIEYNGKRFVEEDTEIEEITVDGIEEIILEDFNAG